MSLRYTPSVCGGARELQQRPDACCRAAGDELSDLVVSSAGEGDSEDGDGIDEVDASGDEGDASGDECVSLLRPRAASA